MKIAFIGKFAKLHDEEYIARSFETLGHTVVRIPQHTAPQDIASCLNSELPDLLMYCKWEEPLELKATIERLKRGGMKTVTWNFDLYIGYQREWQVAEKSFFKSDYVFTTDGGHQNEFKAAGVNHFNVRQGIYAPECYLVDPNPLVEVLFVGSRNPYYEERNAMMDKLAQDFDFRWVGEHDTDHVRGEALNHLFATTKIVVGDSFPSPNYWSNRVVETLGRGGFLIHREVEGIKEEYPDLVTYDGTYEDLKKKIDYYLEHEDERLAIIQKNHELVKSKYTCVHKCQELLNCIS